MSEQLKQLKQLNKFYNYYYKPLTTNDEVVHHSMGFITHMNCDF